VTADIFNAEGMLAPVSVVSPIAGMVIHRAGRCQRPKMIANDRRATVPVAVSTIEFFKTALSSVFRLLEIGIDRKRQIELFQTKLTIPFLQEKSAIEGM